MSLRDQEFGGGKLYAVVGGGWHFYGNVLPGASLSSDVQTKDHMNYNGEFPERDDTFVTGANRTFTFTTDDLNVETLRQLFMGSTSVITQTAQSDITETYTGVIPGQSIILGRSAQNPVGVMDIDVESVSVSGTEKTAGIDYVVDAKRGKITFPAGSTITAEDAIEVTYSTVGSTRSRIITSQDVVETTLRFETVNHRGKDSIYTMPRVKLFPEGSLDLISEDFRQVSFRADVLRQDDLAAVYRDGVPA